MWHMEEKVSVVGFNNLLEPSVTQFVNKTPRILVKSLEEKNDNWP